MAAFNFEAIEKLPLAKQIELLSDRVIEQDYWIGLLKTDDTVTFKIHFSTLELQIVHILLKHKARVLTKDFLYFSLYGDRPECDHPEMKIVDVFICKVRAKLTPKGIIFTTIWGRGWLIDAENHAKLEALKVLPAQVGVITAQEAQSELSNARSSL